MSKLQELLEAKFPMPTTGEILEELKIIRLRSAFVQGLYAGLGEFLKAVPDEDKGGRKGCKYSDTEYDSEAVVYGYNLALDQIMGNYDLLATKINNLKIDTNG